MLERLLGEGGMGQVYLAQHQITDRWVAVKILHQEFASNQEILARIRREAKAAALIGHPNIVEIIDSGTDQYGAPFIAMELLEGESLDDFLEARGPLPVPMACYIVADICDTLAAAHAKGVVHRDMKPENVYMQKRHKSAVPQVKILDFGISKFLTLDKQNMSLTRTGTVMGTPYYMSVEQAMGQKVDGRADIYSVGVILYQLLTCRLPYYDTNYNRVLLQIVAGEHVPVEEIRPDLPEGLSQVVKRAMTKSRDERYPTCTELREALLPYFENEEPSNMFEGEGGSAVETNDLPLRTSTPDVTDPNVINATLAAASSGKKPAEALPEALPGRPKAPIVIAVLLLLGLLGGGGVFLFGRSTSKKPAQESNEQETLEKRTAELSPSSPKGMDPAAKEAPPMEPAMKMPLPMEPDMNPLPAPPMSTEETQYTLLSMKGLPVGARVYYDGKLLKFPYRLLRSRTGHTLMVRARGYVVWTKRVVPSTQSLVMTYKGRRRRSPRTMRGEMEPMTTMQRAMVVMKKPMREMRPMTTTMKKPTNTKSVDNPDF